MQLATLTPPRSLCVVYNAQTGSKVFELCRWQPLRHDVGELLSSWDVHDADGTNSDFLPDKMHVELHMLGASMMHWIRREVDCGDVVT